MKKRYLSLLLVMCMMFSLIPFSAFAEDSAPSGTGIKEESIISEISSDSEARVESKVEPCYTGPGEEAILSPLPAKDDWTEVQEASVLNAERSDYIIDEPMGSSCGEDAEWRFDESRSELIISGSGKLYSYAESGQTPWSSVADMIKKISIGEGITSIGDYNFSGLTSLAEVLLPKTLTSIGKYAFSQDIILETVELPDTVQTIGFGAFSDCTKLAHINIPLQWAECPPSDRTETEEGTYSSEYCGQIFANCAALKTIVVPDGMTQLPAYAFSRCNYLENVTLPKSINTILHHTFYSCSALKSVTVPEKVTYIGKSAFCYCSSLTNVSLPDGVDELALFAFTGCSSLESIRLPDSITTIGYQAFCDCTKLKEINVPLQWKTCPPSDQSSSSEGTDDAKHCGHIFENCKALTEIVVPAEMAQIPPYAFNNSNYLESITLPASIDKIPNHTFFECKALKSVNVPDAVKYIGKSAFCYCTSLSGISLPDGLDELASYTFNGCTALVQIRIPDSVTTIGYKAFCDCTKLQEVVLPLQWKECKPYDKSSTKEGTVDSEHCGHIFEGCKALKSITVPRGITQLPSYAFNACNYLESISLPDTISSISNHTFFNCSALKSVSVPEKVVLIGKSAFCYCSSLTSVTLPDGLDELALFAFNGCSSLVRIHLPDSITKIGFKAFCDCTKLEDVNIPLQWRDCPSGASDGKKSTSSCGHIFENCESLLVLNFPEGMTEIPDYAFCNCTKLKEIRLPDSLISIGNYAFSNCTDLMSVKLPSSVTKIGNYAFSSCTALEMVSLDESLTEVPSYAFSDCTNLAAVSIPSSVVTIADNAFKSCGNLSSVYYQGSSAQWEKANKNNNSVLTTVVVSYGILCDYLAPDHIIDSVYVKPESVSYNSFYGGIPNGSGHALIDVEEASFGPNAHNRFVTIPKDSYISYGFPKPVILPPNALIFLRTTGIVNERADIYLITNTNGLIFIDTVTETTERQIVRVENVKEPISGIKVVGKDLDGASPGFDVVDIALAAKESTDTSEDLSATTATLMLDGKTFDLFSGSLLKIDDESAQASIIINPYWGAEEPGTIAIVQNNEVILSNASGSFVDITPAVLFQPDKDIYVTLLNASNDVVFQKKLSFHYTGSSDPGGQTDPVEPADIEGKPVTAYTDISFRYSVSETTTPGRWELPYSDEMLNRNAREFHNDLAKISLGVAMASTNIAVDGVNVGAEYIQEMLQKMGYVHRTPSANYGDTQIETDSCQYIFAVKKLKGTDDYVVCTVIRSNGYGAAWVSNAHVADGNNIKYSAGFKGAADGVYTELLKYIDSLPVEKSHIRLWVTGFSRGGAIANLLGARLNEESGISANKIFVYGFAVPRTVQKSAAKNYNNIYNIVNQCDLVPRVPLKAWGYERYGVDKFLPCMSKDSLRYRSVRSEMEKYFDSMMSASGLNKTHYSLVSAQERTLDLQLAYLCDIFPTVQSYRDDGYQDAVMNACRMWQLKDSDIPPERLLKNVFGVPEYCGKAIFQLFENWKKLKPPERTAAIIAAEATLNQWASQNGSVQAQKVRNMVLDLLGHVALYVTLDSIPTAASAFSMSKSKQYIELVSLIANLIDRAKEGRAFASALLMQHWPETYLSWMMAGDENRVYSNSSYKVLSVKCPVDITVYDEGGSVVASIVNDEIDESINGLYCETDCFGEKMILIPDDAAYRTVITAREAGTVDIVEQKYSAEDELVDTTCYIQLPMEENQVFNVAVDDDCTVTTNGKTIAPSEVLQENNATVSIRATAQTGGIVVGAKDYSLGDTAELIAIPDEQFSFTGWYEGSKLLSTEEVLHFSAVSNSSLTARFERTTPLPTNPFTDVKEGAYYYDPVLWAVNHVPQITNGTGANTFSPEATCTRDQIVTFLWRAMGCPEPTSAKNPFVDVKPGDYFYKPVLWAVEKEITNGMDATHFGPTVPCTRAHVVTFLWRAHEKPAAGSSNPFRDVPAGQYYTDAVLWAVSRNITNGMDATHFGPDNPCLREQIVTFLYRDLK